MEEKLVAFPITFESKVAGSLLDPARSHIILFLFGCMLIQELLLYIDYASL